MTMQETVSATDATPIARAVQEIVDLDEVYDAADEAHTDLGRQCKAEPCRSPMSDAQLEIENTMARFKKIESAAFERMEMWKHLLLTLEPETIDDALSVLLLVTEEFGLLVDNHVTENDENGVPDVPPEANEIVQRIEGALKAVMRSMVRHGGADSPLLDKFTVPVDFIPWREDAKAARAAAAEMQARRAEQASP